MSKRRRWKAYLKGAATIFDISGRRFPGKRPTLSDAARERLEAPDAPTFKSIDLICPHARPLSEPCPHCMGLS